MPDPSAPRAPAPELPARVRMPLLSLITQQSLDEDYLVAAERRAAGAPRPPRGRPQRTAAVVVAVFGVLAATAFVQTSRNADVDSASRETLIRRIEVERDRLAQQQERAATLRSRTAVLEQEVTETTNDAQEVALANRRLEVRTGFIAVTGEGVRITVEQDPNADDNQEVKDGDLRLLTNGLWEAGAEAIAVNGRRLIASGAIRTSGAAIEVNGSGIAPPFVVEAIGDTRTLAGRLFDTTTGLAFVDNARFYGFTFEVEEDVSDLSLPAAPTSLRQLRSARLPTDEDAANRKRGETP